MTRSSARDHIEPIRDAVVIDLVSGEDATILMGKILAGDMY